MERTKQILRKTGARLRRMIGDSQYSSEKMRRLSTTTTSPTHPTRSPARRSYGWTGSSEPTDPRTRKVADAGLEEARAIAYIVRSESSSRFLHGSLKAISEITDLIKGWKCDAGFEETVNEVSDYRIGELRYLLERDLRAIDSVKILMQNPDASFRQELEHIKEELISIERGEEEEIKNFRSLFLKEV